FFSFLASTPAPAALSPKDTYARGVQRKLDRYDEVLTRIEDRERRLPATRVAKLKEASRRFKDGMKQVRTDLDTLRKTEDKSWRTLRGKMQEELAMLRQESQRLQKHL